MQKAGDVAAVKCDKNLLKSGQMWSAQYLALWVLALAIWVPSNSDIT